MMRKNWLCVACVALVLSCVCGCQKTPEQSIVKEKDFDKMIEAAKQTEATEEETTVAEQVTYTANVENENLRVKVKATEVKVELPDVEKMSILRVQQKKITQEEIDTLISLVAPGVKLYDGAVVLQKTKADIDELIKSEEEEIENVRERIKEGVYTEKGGAFYIEEYEESIKELKAERDTFPEVVNWEDYNREMKLTSTRELYEYYKTVDYYKGAYNLNENGDEYFAVSDGKDENYISIFAQNNANYGNCLRFRKGRNGFIGCQSVLVGDSYGTASHNLGMWSAKHGFSEGNLLVDLSMRKPVEITNEPATLTEDEARKRAENFMAAMGFTDYALYEGELCYEAPKIIERYLKEENTVPYRKVYVFKYLRNIEGALVNIADPKSLEGWVGETYVKKYWPGEEVVVYVNNDGVVGLDWNAPLEVTEVVVDRANMKSFEEIQEIFEQMVVVANAKETGEMELEVKKVTLSYTRISQKDDFEHGVFVPVWDFRGTVKDVSGAFSDVQYDESILSINAIDGTVIDRALGY